MMDKAGIEVAVLRGSGSDQPSPAICRLINDRTYQVEKGSSGRFIGLAHVPAQSSWMTSFVAALSSSGSAVSL
jgi:hypothetical protein